MLRLTAAEGDRFIAFSAQTAPEKLPVARAFAAGQIGIVEVPRSAPFPPEPRHPTSKPILAIIGDDDYASTGPKGFPGVKRFCYWARAAIVHGAGGQPEHYEEAVRATRAVRHVVLIETDAAHISEWRFAFGNGARIPILQILPRDGVHPVRGRLQ